MLDVQVVQQPNGKWTIFDAGKETFLHENLSEDEAIDRLAFLMKPAISKWLKAKPKQMSYLECQVRAGRILCCVCSKPVTLKSYEIKWPLEKQRCEVCHG